MQNLHFRDVSGCAHEIAITDPLAAHLREKGIASGSMNDKDGLRLIAKPSWTTLADIMADVARTRWIRSHGGDKAIDPAEPDPRPDESFQPFSYLACYTIATGRYVTGVQYDEIADILKFLSGDNEAVKSDGIIAARWAAAHAYLSKRMNSVIVKRLSSDDLIEQFESRTYTLQAGVLREQVRNDPLFHGVFPEAEARAMRPAAIYDWMSRTGVLDGRIKPS